MNDIAKQELAELLQGNARFINGECSCEKRTLKTLQALSTHQDPKSLILSCSDSRVIPEIIFDCEIGKLFVIRTAGASIGVTNDIIQNIEFAIDKFNIALIIIMSHDDCGVMTYAKKCQYAKSHFKSLIKDISPIIEHENSLTCNEIARKYTLSLEKIFIEHSEIIKNALQNNKIAIVNAHFSLGTGKVELI